jgi:hypothetical protein
MPREAAKKPQRFKLPFCLHRQPYLQPWKSYEIARSNNQFPPRRKLLSDSGCASALCSLILQENGMPS